MKLHPEVQALSKAMHALENCLRQNNAVHWADQVARCTDLVDESNAYGLQRFLSLFGGMGSLNDFVLVRDGVWLTAENDQLNALRSRAWKLADALKSELR